MILNFFDNIKIEQPATASHKEPSVNNQQNVTGIFVGIFATFVLATILLFSGILFYKTWKANRSETTPNSPTESDPEKTDSEVKKAPLGQTDLKPSVNKDNPLISTRLAESTGLSFVNKDNRDKINLLDLNLTEATFRGSWTRYGDKLRSSEQRSGLALPVPIPDKFQLQFTIRCIEGDGKFSVGIVKEGFSFLTTIEPTKATIENIDDEEVVFTDNDKPRTNQNDISRSRVWVGEYNCILRVNGDNIILDIDGQNRIFWQGDLSRLSRSQSQNLWGYINYRFCFYTDHSTVFEISDISIQNLENQ